MHALSTRPRLCLHVAAGTVGGNVLSLSGFYLLFIGMGYVFLRYLYKERR